MAAQSFQLVMRSGPTPGKVFELTQGEIVIGRETSNQIVINDAEISRRHARLVAQSGGYMIEDLGSTNGTFVNGQRLMGPHFLSHGELINVGENVSLAFQAPQFDPNATLASSPPAYGVGAAQTLPSSSPSPYSPVQPEPVSPAYSGNVPPGPIEPDFDPLDGYYDEVPADDRRRTLMFVGVGCLVVMLCVLVAAGVAFDLLDWYCIEPFDAIFYCP